MPCLPTPSSMSGRSCRALNRPGDDCRVVIEGTDEWVFAQELQRLLLLGSSSDQLPQRAEPIALV